MSKTIAVFGAGSNVGAATVQLLEKLDTEVIKVGYTAGYHQKTNLKEYSEVKQVANRLKHANKAVNGVVCVLRGYAKDVSQEYSLSTIPHKTVRDEFDIRIFGLIWSFQAMLPVIAQDGSIVFVSDPASHSMISDIQEILLQYMKNDQKTTARGVQIHYVGFIGTNYDAVANTIVDLF